MFFIAYVIVTLLATATSAIYGAISSVPPPAPGVSPVLAPVFLATVPYHVLIMLIVWPLFAMVYFKKPASTNPFNERSETRSLALLWLASAILVDFVGFVWIQTPFSLTPHAFYIDYQPWISLIYLAIFSSPWIRFTLVGRERKKSKLTGD